MNLIMIVINTIVMKTLKIIRVFYKMNYKVFLKLLDTSEIKTDKIES